MRLPQKLIRHEEGHPSLTIAIVGLYPPVPGGMTQLAVELARNLECEGHAVVRVNIGHGLLSYIKLPVLYLNYAISFLKCDIVHIIAGSGNALWLKDLPAIMMARLMGKRVIMNFVGGAALDKAHTWGGRKRLPFRLSHTVVVPSESFKKALIDQGIQATFKVISNIVDVNPFLGLTLKNEKKVLLAAKGLSSYAGYDLLLDAFEIVRRQIPGAQLWIAGDGPLRTSLEEVVEQRRLGGVRFWGNVPHEQMPNLMSESALFVHCSRYESFGIALVEAMAAGRPVVAFSVGGIPNVVPHGVAGSLVPYGDIDTFASTIVKLLRDEGAREEIGRFGRSHSTQFGWDRLKHEWYSVYGITDGC